MYAYMYLSVSAKAAQLAPALPVHSFWPSSNMSLAGGSIASLAEEVEATSMAVEEGRQLYQALWKTYDDLVKSSETQDSHTWPDQRQQEYQSILQCLREKLCEEWFEQRKLLCEQRQLQKKFQKDKQGKPEKTKQSKAQQHQQSKARKKPSQGVKRPSERKVIVYSEFDID